MGTKNVPSSGLELFTVKGLLPTISAQENIKRVHDLVLQGRGVTQIVEDTGLSISCAIHEKIVCIDTCKQIRKRHCSRLSTRHKQDTFLQYLLLWTIAMM